MGTGDSDPRGSDLWVSQVMGDLGREEREGGGHGDTLPLKEVS